MGRPPLCAAASARSQQGRSGQPAAGDRGAGGDARRDAGAVLGAAGRHRGRRCVARIKDDLRAWQLGRCGFVGDAGMYSAANLAALSRGLGRYILAVPMRKVTEIEAEVLTRPGRYKPVADNLQVKEVVVGKPAPA